MLKSPPPSNYSPFSTTTAAVVDNTYQNFINSIRAEETKKKYSDAWDKYIEFLGLKDRRNDNNSIYLLLLEEQNPRVIENNIIHYIVKLRNEGYSSTTISIRLAGIIHFYTMNDIILNKKKIGKYLGEHKKTIKDRAYTVIELKKIIDACNLKYKIVVTMMVSTGCRIGSIASLKISDLRYIEKEKLHQIFFYINTKEEYFSFCSYECSKCILEYLNYRERSGEILKPESPLIRDDFKQDDLLHIENPKPITTHNIKYYLQIILIKTGLRIRIKQDGRGAKKNMRKLVSANHGFRKFTHTTMANARISPEIRELLLGHHIGLSSSYYRPTEKEMLDEYLKVVNDLTIDPSHRLQKQVQELNEEKQETEYVIKGKLQEITEQNQVLTSKLNKYEENAKQYEKYAKEFANIYIMIQELKNDQRKEREQETEYETTTIDDLDTKDFKFEEFVKSRRERMKKERNLIEEIKQK